MRGVSRRARGVAEGEQEARDLGLVLGGWRGAAGDPVEQLGIGAFEQRFVFVEPLLVETGEMRLGERSEDQVGLARAAVPGAEQQPLAADVARCFGPTCFMSGGWHGFSDIAMLSRNVSPAFDNPYIERCVPPFSTGFSRRSRRCPASGRRSRG